MHNSYQGQCEVMHVGLMVHNPCKWYEYTHEWVGGAQFQYWGQVTLVMPNFRNASKLCTWGLVVHNSTNSLQSYAHGGLVHNSKEGTKLHKSWFVMHNF